MSISRFTAYCLLPTAYFLAGCTYNGDPKPQSTTRPSEAAVKDPYGKWSTMNTDITGGGVSNLNRDALKRDTDSLLLK